MLKGKYLIFLVCLFSFLFFSSNCFAGFSFQEISQEELENHIKLPDSDAENLLNKLPQVLTENWLDLMISVGDSEKQAVLVIVRKSVQKNLLNYLLVQAPKEVIKEIADAGFKVWRLSTTPDLSGFLSEIEKITVKEARKYLTEWMIENETKIAIGDLEIFYTSLDNQKQKQIFQYIIIYQPITQELGEAEIRIYSSKTIAPPRPEGDPWSISMNNFWLPSDDFIKGKKKISPFILTVTGKVKREKAGYWRKEIIHKYSWVSEPEIEISFPENVPHFDFSKKSFWQRKLTEIKDSLNKTSKAVKNAGSKVGLGLSEIGKKIKDFFSKISQDISRLFGAQLVEQLPFQEAQEKTESLVKEEKEEIEPITESKDLLGDQQKQKQEQKETFSEPDYLKKKN
jgi:hypothetical protein